MTSSKPRASIERKRGVSETAREQEDGVRRRTSSSYLAGDDVGRSALIHLAKKKKWAEDSQHNTYSRSRHVVLEGRAADENRSRILDLTNRPQRASRKESKASIIQTLKRNAFRDRSEKKWRAC